jgi:uncharacterized protein
MNYYTVSPETRKNSILNLSATMQLLILNVFLFIIFEILLLMKVIPLDFIAINPSNILEGKFFWTIIVSMFMHAGIFHLFVNMISLLFVGSLVEKLVGKKRYVYFYLFSGIFSSLFFVLTSYLFGIDLNAYAVGASGALFGLIGLLMILTPDLPVYIMFIPIPVKMKYAAPFMLGLLWIISLAGNVPIGNVAHLGGLVAGIIYGLVLIKKFPRRTKYLKRHFS